MGKGANVSDKYAVTAARSLQEPEQKKKKKKKSHADEESAAGRPSTAELQLSVDYASAEAEEDIGDPHRSAVIIPGFAGGGARQTKGADDDSDGYDELADVSLGADGEEQEEIEKPELGAFGAVDPLLQRAYEQQQHNRAKRSLALGRWERAIREATDGLEIDQNSRALDRDLTRAYLSWGQQELGAGNYGSAAVVFRQGIEEDPRDLSELQQGLDVANRGERAMRVAVYQDLPCAGCFCGLVALTVLLALIGAASSAPRSACELDQPCKNGAECTDNLIDGSHTCTCAAGWSGLDCGTLGEATTPEPEPEPDPGDAAAAAAAVPLTDAETKQVLGSMLIAAAAAGLWSLLWLKIVRSFPRKLVWLTLGTVVVGEWVVGGALLAGVGSPNGESNGFGIMFFLASCFMLLMGVIMRSWVPFGVAMFRSATEVMADHSSMLTVALVAMLADLAWLFLVGLALLTTGFATGGSLVVYLAYFWFAQVSKAVVHCTVAGATANWYFVTYQINPVAQACRRASTTSLVRTKAKPTRQDLFGLCTVPNVLLPPPLLTPPRHTHGEGLKR